VTDEIVAYTEDHLRKILLWCLDSHKTPTKEMLDLLVLGKK
jgi:hypothetical protein